MSAQAVSADQRRRLCAATIDLVAECGYERVTVRALSKQAGVSTRTFYRHFSNAADCLGFACESTMRCSIQRMDEARSAADDWESGLRAAMASIMEDFGSRPDAASVTLVEAYAGGPKVLARTNAMTGAIEQLLAELLGGAPLPGPVPRRLLSGMVAGMMRVARITTLAGRAAELPGLAPDVSNWILSLFLLSREGRLDAPIVGRSELSQRRELRPFPDSRSVAREEVIGDERQRIVRATVRLAASDGFSGLTIPRIRRAAGVSRRSFDSHFESVTDCFLDSIEWVTRSAAGRAAAWVDGDSDLTRRIRRLLLALGAQAARNDALAGLVLGGILGAGRKGLLRREHLVTLGAAGIRKDLPRDRSTGDLGLDASVAASWEVAHAEISSGRARGLPGLSPLFAHLILAPVHVSEAEP